MGTWNIETFKKAIQNKQYNWTPNKPMIIGVRMPFGIPNTFEDYIVCIWEAKNFFIGLQATTEPGKFYLEKPMNPNGTFIIAPGQYKNSHTLGTHGTGRTHHRAFELTGKLLGHRDNDHDSIAEQTGIMVSVGPEAGVDIHSTGLANYIPSTIDNWSAGCQVVQRNDLFQENIIGTFDKWAIENKLRPNQVVIDYTLLLSTDLA